MRKIGIVGGGAWGTALAVALRRAGREVVLWAREPEVAAAIAERRENPVFLPGIRLDANVRATGELGELAGAEALLLAVPAQHLRAVAEALAEATPADRPLVICAKGIEAETGALMSEVLAEALAGRPQAVLSGPTFAGEVARGLPTAVTLAAHDPVLGEALIDALGSRSFRPYLSDDPVGVQIGGAVKNVIAIACGIVAGRAMGDNARAALVTRGLAEMRRLGLAKGARAETLMGLSGLGDLTLTCTGAASRNYTLGIALGEGRALADVLAERRSVTEGVTSAAAVTGLAERHRTDMPIVAAVDAVLNRKAEIGPTIEALLARPFRAELE